MGVLNHAPWGGLIVLPVVEGWLGYILGIIVGSLITALMVNFLKKDNKDITDYDKEIQIEDDLDIEFTEL